MPLLSDLRSNSRRRMLRSGRCPVSGAFVCDKISCSAGELFRQNGDGPPLTRNMYILLGQVNGLLERMLRQKFGKEKIRFIDCTER